MRARILSKLLLVGCLIVLVNSGNVVRATVGWCASDPGSVDHYGYRDDGGILYAAQGDDNWSWHDGGENTWQQCWNDTVGSLIWCDSYCNNPGLNAADICALNTTIEYVDAYLDALYFNPEGYEAYQQHGGTYLGSPQTRSYCCLQFGLNC